MYMCVQGRGEGGKRGNLPTPPSSLSSPPPPPPPPPIKSVNFSIPTLQCISNEQSTSIYLK